MKIIAVHGIRRQYRWFNALKNLSIWEKHKIDVIPFEYGYFHSYQFSMSFCRNKIYDKFYNFYSSQINSTEPPPSIVCHSFGTLILLNALLKYDSIVFNDVILCGSIIDPNQDWEQFILKGQIKRVLNQFGNKDEIVEIPKIIGIKNSGNSGKVGFQNVPEKYKIDKTFVQEERKHFGHSDYFLKPHIEKTWIPFFLEGFEKYDYDKSILRDDIIHRAYENNTETSSLFKVNDAYFKAKVDFFSNRNGHYYASYTFKCTNISHSAMYNYRVKTTADSLGYADEMGFYAFKDEVAANCSIISDKNQEKEFDIFLENGVKPNSQFTLNYRFMWKDTMSKKGDTDHFSIKGIENVHAALNFKSSLNGARFYILKDKRIVDTLKAQVKKEPDESFTYYIDFTNNSNNDVIIFYYNGVNSEIKKNTTFNFPVNFNGQKLNITNCSENDIRQVYSIETQVEHSNAASEDTLLMRRKMFNDGFLVIKDNANNVLGYIESVIWKDRQFDSFDEIKNFPLFHNLYGDTLYIIFLAVAPQYRKQGFGKALLKGIEKVAEKYKIKTIKLVAKGELVKYYKKSRYLEIEELPNFLKGKKETSILMKKDLSPNNGKNAIAISKYKSNKPKR